MIGTGAILPNYLQNGRLIRLFLPAADAKVRFGFDADSDIYKMNPRPAPYICQSS